MSERASPSDSHPRVWVDTRITEPGLGRAGSTTTRRRWRLRILAQKAALFGAVVLAVVVAGAVLAPVLFPMDLYAQHLGRRLKPPLFQTDGRVYVLGTDYLGRDILDRIVHGSWISLLVSSVSVMLSSVFGTALGVLAGYHPRWLGGIIMRIVDAQLAFPFVLLTIAILGVFGPTLANVILVFAVTSWPIYARTVRASVLSLKGREFVQAAQGLGASSWRILVRHIVPNCVSPLLVIASYEMSRIILLEAALGFLGLGVPPPTPTWGNMLADGRQYITSAWWSVTFPGLAIVLTVSSINFIGDGLRDLLDPRHRYLGA